VSVDLVVRNADHEGQLFGQDQVGAIIVFNDDDAPSYAWSNANGQLTYEQADVPEMAEFGIIGIHPSPYGVEPTGLNSVILPFRLDDEHRMVLLNPVISPMDPLENQSEVLIGSAESRQNNFPMFAAGCDQECAVMVVRASGVVLDDPAAPVDCQGFNLVTAADQQLAVVARADDGISVTHNTVVGPNVDLGVGWLCLSDNAHQVFVTNDGSLVVLPPEAPSAPPPQAPPAANNAAEEPPQQIVPVGGDTNTGTNDNQSSTTVNPPVQDGGDTSSSNSGPAGGESNTCAECTQPQGDVPTPTPAPQGGEPTPTPVF
jgi:hypothetical protein